MNITTDAAKAIVAEISNTINKNVNLMDETGLIIASTVPERVGTYHKGAQKIIQEKLDCLTIYTDYEYTGSKVGINMPIYFQGEIAGVIGISGEWDEISQYVQLIRKATEILLMDSYLKKREQYDEASRRDYVYKLLFEDSREITEPFLDYGLTLGIDPMQPRICAVLSFLKGKRGERPKEIYEYLDQVEQKAVEYAKRKKQTLVYRELTQIALFIPGQDAGQAEAEVRKVTDVLKLPEGIACRIGMDDMPYTGAGVRFGYTKACKSLSVAMTLQNGDLVRYSQLTLGLFVDEVSRKTREEYVKRIFSYMPDDEIEKWVELLEMFYRCEGSITETAAELYVHKNTLQYQLKKLASITGYDPRSLSSAGLYQTAIKFYRSL